MERLGEERKNGKARTRRFLMEISGWVGRDEKVRTVWSSEESQVRIDTVGQAGQINVVTSG